MMDHLVKDGILTQEQRDKTWEFIVSHQSEEAEKLSKKREQREVAQSEELSIPKRVVATEKDVDFFNLHVMSRLLQIRFIKHLPRFFHPFRCNRLPIFFLFRKAGLILPTKRMQQTQVSTYHQEKKSRSLRAIP